jgi:glycosyltransferase involved in cell wall biosynthesis
MNKPLISVVMCTYNGEDFLKEQLDSLLTQTYRPLEIIISDDCSTDNTAAILKSYSHHEVLKIFYQQDNLGPVRNFEFAALQATGSHIAFSDQDDIWMPHKIQRLYDNMGEASLVYSDSELVDENGGALNIKLSDLKHMYSGNDSRGFILYNVVWGHTMMVSKALLQQSLPIPTDIPHDIWLAFKAVTLNCIVYVDEVLAKYRQHSKTYTKTLPQKYQKRKLYQRYKAFKKKLEWISIMQANERSNYQSFYKKLLALYKKKQTGHYSLPLFFFLVKNWKALFQFSKKSMLSQFIEIMKQARGESSNV